MLSEIKRTMKTSITRLVPKFFFLGKNIENTENIKFREQYQFSDNTKMIFFVFSKIVLKTVLKNMNQIAPYILY